MDRVAVFNLAVAYFNNEPREKHEWDEGDKLAKLCDLYVNRAEDTVRRAYPWSFLTKALSDIPEPTVSEESEYKYHYILPSDFSRMVKVENDYAEYRIIGSNVISKEKITGMYYISKDATSDDVTYENMVANRLALLLLPSQGGDGNLYNFLNSEYERMKEELMRGEISARRESVRNAKISL